MPLTIEENKLYLKQNVCPKKFNTNENDKKYCTVRDFCCYTGKYKGTAPNVCNLRYNTPKETPIVFHNASNCEYNFIINELAEKN